MSITLTCPSCGQMCAVADEHAGKQVACPRCRGVISVPAGTATATPGAGTPVAAPVPGAPVAASTPASAGASAPFAFEGAPPASHPPTPPVAPARKALAALDDAARALGLDEFNKILLYAGWGCLCLLALTTLFPWMSFTLPRLEASESNVSVVSIGRLGVSHSGGLMTLLFTLEVAFLLVFAFFLGKSQQFFQIALWAAAWWGIHSFLWRLIDVVQLSKAAGW